MASDLRWSRRLAVGFAAAAYANLLTLGLWADGLIPTTVLPLVTLATLSLLAGAAVLGRSGLTSPPARREPLVDPSPTLSIPDCQCPYPASTYVLRLRRGPHRFIFAAPRERRMELECAIAGAVRDGWIDWDEAAELERQLTGVTS